jgi:hypothetical protein
VFYEKDRIMSLDGKPLPTWDKATLEKFPEGYRWFGAAQEKLGHKMLFDLPTFKNQWFYDLYEGMNLWLEGKDAKAARKIGVPEDRI